MPTYNIVVFAGDHCGPEVSQSRGLGPFSGYPSCIHIKREENNRAFTIGDSRSSESLRGDTEISR